MFLKKGTYPLQLFQRSVVICRWRRNSFLALVVATYTGVLSTEITIGDVTGFKKIQCSYAHPISVPGVFP